MPRRASMTDLSFLFVGMDEAERLTRLRELRALVAVYCGWDHPAKLPFDAAVQGTAEELQIAAIAEVAKLPSLTRRRLLSSYGALNTKGF